MEIGTWFGVLGERDFRLFWTGRAASFIGTGMLPVALAFAVLARHGSTSDVGYVLGAETLPLVLFLLVGGVAADRLNRRVVMLGADVLRGVAQSVLAAWIIVGRPPLWGFLVLEALVGTGTAFFTPAMTGLIPQVVASARLQQANALNGLAEWSGRLLGPALAGVLVATVGAGWAVGVDAASYLVSAACLAALRVGWSGTEATEPFLSQLRTGWREFRARTWLWAIVSQFSLYGLVVFAPFFVLGAVVADQSLGGAEAWGIILAVQGAGSVLASIVLLRVRPRRPLVVAELAFVTFALPLVALGLRTPTAVVAVAAFLSGIGFGTFGPLWDTTMRASSRRSCCRAPVRTTGSVRSCSCRSGTRWREPWRGCSGSTARSTWARHGSSPPSPWCCACRASPR